MVCVTSPSCACASPETVSLFLAMCSCAWIQILRWRCTLIQTKRTRRTCKAARRATSKAYKAKPEDHKMKIAIGADHAGFELKQCVKAQLLELKHEVLDLGTHDTK